MKTLVTPSDLGLRLNCAADIPALIGAAYGADGLLLYAGDLDATFLDLRTGLLGELFQKCVNYRLPVAFLVPDAAAYGPRFTELALEHATHPQIRFFTAEAAARAWLESLN